uniref:Mast cell protease 1A-like n=1 Tax=Pelodiscus sinensis TaxID=13735 RepID=K7FWZ9_PELSI|nr:mast cell protease 1A-like [Pelodiscus sinensis]|eukprot:XP_025044691.1 mast cell protease 1A-like [Pelodiscus sinensis]
MQLLVVGLLPWAFLLPPGGWAGEIIGGKEAKPHSRPYMAYLQMKRNNDHYTCGGFLVAKNFVLTAAHCWGEITVTLGAHNIRKREPSRQVIQVRRQIPHPQYDRETLNNDIMLLQLAEPAKLDGWVETIALPCAGEEAEPGMVCRVAGWGCTIATDHSSAASALQEVEVEVLADAECNYRNYVSSTMLCAGLPWKGKDSAKGDSGGPLVCGAKAQGIVSWGPDTPPGVYTRVSTYNKWIKDTMRGAYP